MKTRKLSPGSISWALYDWANSAYTLIVITAFFGPFFENYYAVGKDNALSIQSFTVGITGLLVAILAPFLGALANRGGKLKRYLAACVFLGATGTLGLTFTGEGQWQLACVWYLLGGLGFYCGNIFYDSMIVNVSDSHNRHFVSGLGFSLGYLGSVILFLFDFYLYNNYESFGFETKNAAVKFIFLTVAIWWVVFTLPLLFKVKEDVTQKTETEAETTSSLESLKRTLRNLVKEKHILFFILAYWFYIDGVHTLITLAAGYGQAIGISSNEMMLAIIAVQVIGIPCALVFGLLGEKLGARNLLIFGVIVYVGVTFYAANMTPEPVSLFGKAISPAIILGLLIGSVQGGVQSLSRSYFASIIPEREAASYFGLYNMVGKSASILGPFLVGVVPMITGKAQHGILAVAFLFALGLGLLFLCRPARDVSTSHPH